MGNPAGIYRNYDLLFTPHLIPQLRSLRNQTWSELMDTLSALPETHADVLAFAVMMIGLSGCLSCERDSYRAQRGCARCARHAIITFKGNDQQLIECYKNARRIIGTRQNETGLEKAA